MVVWRHYRTAPDLTYVSPEVKLGKAVRESWEQKVLLDFTIEVEGEQFKVHKLVMVSVSDYFKAMLMGGMVESQTDRVKLEGLKSLAVSNIIEYVYTNRITKARASPEDLLASAVYLQIPTAIEAACDMIQKKLNKENCFEVLTTFETYSLKDAVKSTKEYLKSKMIEILAFHRLERLSYEHFLILVKIWSKGEWDLLHMIKDWVTVDYENRKQHLDSLTSHMDFTLISAAELQIIKQMNIYSEGSWKKNVEQALEHHAEPVYSKLRGGFSVRGERPDPTPVCFTRESSTTMHVLGKDKNWKPVTVPATPDFSDGVALVMEHNGFIIVFEEYSDNQKIHVLDPSMMKWSTIASMLTPRSGFALVCDEEYFYALGGRINVDTESESVTNSIESYHIESNTWTVMPATMPVPLYGHSACMGHGTYCAIYVTGGWLTTDEDGDCSTRLDCFDPDEPPHTWKSRAPMLVAAPCYVMQDMEFNGKEDVLVVLFGDFAIQYYDMETDQWSIWNACDDIFSDLIYHGNGTVLCHPFNHTFYLLNMVCDLSLHPERAVLRCCGKWDVDDQSLNIAEERLQGFPIDTEDWDPDAEKNYIVAMITMPKPSVRKPAPAVRTPAPVVKTPAPVVKTPARAVGGRGYNLRKRVSST